MPTKVKDQATAERAALSLNTGVEVAVKPGEPSAPIEKGTTEKLFPEFMTEDGAVVNRPVKLRESPFTQSPATATPAPVAQPQITPQTAPTVPTYLKPEEVVGKMVKVKVDGIESDVPAETLVKNYQLERHLNSQLMNLAEERKRMEAERQAILSRPQQPELPKTQKQQEPTKTTPGLEAMEAKIQRLESVIDQLGSSMAPVLRETGLKRIDQEVKERIGTTDFMDYAPKIQAFVDAENMKPEVRGNPQAQQQLLSSGFWYQKYQEMKLRDLATKPAAPAPAPLQPSNAPVLQTQEGAPVVLNNQGRPVSMPFFESSGGVPSGNNSEQNVRAEAQRAFDTARQTGRTEDWMSYYRLKTQLPS